VCRQPIDWGTTGWCFVAPQPPRLTSGQPVTLSISLCRNGSSAARVRFPHDQQASWRVVQGATRFWSSNQQPAPFTAGEVVTLSPGECLRWRTDWRVTTDGRPMPPGDYLLQWNTGADLRSADGGGYQDSANVQVSEPQGASPVVAGRSVAAHWDHEPG
jgi:hypothetical protein